MHDFIYMHNSLGLKVTVACFSEMIKNQYANIMQSKQQMALHAIFLLKVVLAFLDTPCAHMSTRMGL